MANDGREGNGVDLVSSLPDEILQHILSFLATRFAIRTSLLSKRWRHVWSETPLSLYFYEVDADSINKTLARYTSRKMISFNICVSHEEDIPYLDEWIKFAMSRSVEKMSLGLGREYNIPDWFYINPSIKQLNIQFVGNSMKFCPVSWTSLKKLSLSGSYLSDRCFAKILSGCPILESLTLYVQLFCNLRVLDLSKSPRIKTLEIDRSEPVSNPMQIVAPHINCLILRNYMLPCTLDDISSNLIEAALDFSIMYSLSKSDSLQVMVLKILQLLHIAEKFTFGPSFLKILSLARLQRAPFPMFNFKDLTFETNICQYAVPGIVKVLQNSPQVKNITVYITNCSPKYGNNVDNYGIRIQKRWSLRILIVGM